MLLKEAVGTVNGAKNVKSGGMNNGGLLPRNK